MVLHCIARAILRNLRRVRISNLLLTALVGLNLTLVCQGHDVAHHHLGPHITFLGEAAHIMSVANHDTTGSAPLSLISPADAFGPADMPGRDPAQTDMTSMYMPGMNAYDTGQLPSRPTAAAPGSIGPNIPSAITAPQLESLSLDALSFMLLPLLLRRGPNLRPLEIAETTPEKSQTGTTPEPPPPRPSPA